MPHFKAKMHQIPLRLGLRPRPRWGSLQRSHRTLTRLGVLLLRVGEGDKGMEVMGNKEWEWRGEEPQKDPRTPPTFVTD